MACKIQFCCWAALTQVSAQNALEKTAIKREQLNMRVERHQAINQKTWVKFVFDGSIERKLN